MLKKIALLPALCLCLLTACNNSTAPAASTAQAPTAGAQFMLAGTRAAKPAESIKWLTIEQAAERMKTEPRKLVIDVYTDWCGWCKKMDKDTFTDPAVAALINKHYYAVKLDAEGKEPITLNGQTFTYNPQNRAHDLAVALLNGQMSFPTTVYLDEELKMLSPVPGYLDAKSFLQISRYFGENHHKTVSWHDYKSQVK